MLTPVKTYFKTIEDNLRMGNAAEHTHRPALKALPEAFDPGAPDFVTTT